MCRILVWAFLARAYRWLGGIGYILEFIPYAGFISSIFVAVA